MEKCLLTGIGGSIGIHVFAHIMHNTDWNVVGIDSFRHNGYTDRVTTMLGYHPEWTRRLQVFRHDLAAPISPVLRRTLGEPSTIINLASASDVFHSIEDPVPHVTNNVALILNMLEYARETKPKAFMQVSTDEVYGPTDGSYLHKEWSPIVPSNPYSASKAAQEAISIAYWRTYNVPLVLVNLMNNFGEMQSRNKFPVIVQRKVEKGEPVTIHGDIDTLGTRFYIHSRNSADAFLHILRNTTPHMHVGGTQDKPDRYNIVGSSQVDNLTMARTIAKFMGRKLAVRFEPFDKARPGHDQHYGLDGTKLEKLGWKVPKGFEESLKQVVEWQVEHPEWLE